MDFPRGVPAVEAAILLYAPPAAPGGDDPDPWADVRAALAAGLETASPVKRMVGLYDAMRPRLSDLVAAGDAAGLALLAGIARQIGASAWGNKGAEPMDVQVAAIMALNALPG